MLASVGATPELTESCTSRSSCCRVSRVMKGDVTAAAVPLGACLALFFGGIRQLVRLGRPAVLCVYLRCVKSSKNLQGGQCGLW